MLDTLKTLLTTLAGERTSSTDDGDDPESTLYRCPDCEAVYVAVEKAECSACRTAVERVERSSWDS